MPTAHCDVMRETEFVTVGKIVKPFGVRGQVRVLSLTDVPGRLENLTEVTLETSSGHSLVTEVIDVLDDPFLLNRQFARISLEKKLDIRLLDFGYRFYMTSKERRDPLRKIRAHALEQRGE